MGNSLSELCTNDTADQEQLIPHDPPQVGHVNVLSYNLFIRPPFINNNGDDYKDERMKEFLDLIQSYDVICLQEMFNVYSSRRRSFIEKARQQGFLFHTVAPKPLILSKYFIDAGLLILSRYPIKVTDFCLFPFGLGVDCYVQKGVLYAQIAIGSTKLHIYNTHPQANYYGDADFLKRSDQFTSFEKFVKATLSQHGYREEDMVLFVGDFNVNSRSTTRFSAETLAGAPHILHGRINLLKRVHFTEYEALLSYLSDDHKDEIEDLLLTDLGEHPITFGDCYVGENNVRKPLETVLTSKHSLCTEQSLDYIFKYVPRSLLEDNSTSWDSKPSTNDRLTVMKGSAKVEKFLVHGHTFDQLSDHYGVKVTLEYIKGTEEKILTDIHKDNLM